MVNIMPNGPRDCDGREIRTGYLVETVEAGGTGDRFKVRAYGVYTPAEAQDGYWMVLFGASGPGGVGSDAAQADTLRVVEPAPDGPEHGTTDELLHRLRELVADAQAKAPERDVRPGHGFTPEWVRLFDELDYRMSHLGYVLPDAWGELR